MSSKDMPTRHDILAEHLYAKIEELNPVVSPAKITGMLVEGEDSQVMRMLQDPSFLHMSVEKAIRVLENQNFETLHGNDSISQTDYINRNSAVVSCPELCDQLYDQVAVLEPELAPHLTGMLVELDHAAVSEMLSDEDILKKAVKKAKHSYLENQDSFSAECNNNTESEVTMVKELGDIVYNKVYLVFPQFAAEITGMLLEMDETILRDLLSNPKGLQTCIQKAYDALRKDSITN